MYDKNQMINTILKKINNYEFKQKYIILTTLSVSEILSYTFYIYYHSSQII